MAASRQREEDPLQRFVVVAAAVLGLAGCGGSSTKPNAAPSTAATHQTPTITQAGTTAAVSVVKQIGQRLEAAGYASADQGATGSAIAQFSPIGNMSIYVYRTREAAAPVYDQIKQVFRAHPQRGIVRQIQARVYSLGKPHNLSAADHARFAKVVKVAEGK
jgi:hypothetical protein